MDRPPLARRLGQGAISLAIKLLTGVTVRRAEGLDAINPERPRIYYANHSSHLDFLVIWAALPARLRERAVPVAAADYWGKTPARRFVAKRVFQAALVERNASIFRRDPLKPVREALDAGRSIIVFPEGTRGEASGGEAGAIELGDFKPGLHKLAKDYAGIELTPVWLENLNYVLPKGEFLPAPLLCFATFGDSIRLEAKESRKAFLARARAELVALAEAKPAAGGGATGEAAGGGSRDGAAAS